MVEKTQTTLEKDHIRGCRGREYTCSCGHDEAKDTELRKMREALNAIRTHLGALVSAPHELMPTAWHIANNALEVRS